jgi:hypothetical protein
VRQVSTFELWIRCSFASVCLTKAAKTFSNVDIVNWKYPITTNCFIKRTTLSPATSDLCDQQYCHPLKKQPAGADCSGFQITCDTILEHHAAEPTQKHNKTKRSNFAFLVLADRVAQPRALPTASFRGTSLAKFAACYDKSSIHSKLPCGNDNVSYVPSFQ